MSNVKIVATKVPREHDGFDELEPQQVTNSDSVINHVHWDRVTVGVLVLATGVFWIQGQRLSRELDQQTNAAVAMNGASPHELEPQAISLALLPQHVDKPNVSVRFDEPSPAATVGASFKVRGTVRQVPEGKHLWLVTMRDTERGFWAKDRVELDDSGHFEQKTWEYGPNGPLSVCVLATTVEDSIRFEAWLAVGDRDDEWPVLQPIAGSEMLGCQSVSLSKHLAL